MLLRDEFIPAEPQPPASPAAGPSAYSARMARPFVSRRDLARALLLAAFGFGMAAPLGLTVAVADRVLVRSLYGADAADRRGLHVASHVPMRISNGDRVREFNGFVHFVGAVVGWLVLAVVALFLVRRLLPAGYRRVLDRMGAPRGSNPDPAARRGRGGRWVIAAMFLAVVALLVARQAAVMAALSGLAILCAHFCPLTVEPPAGTIRPSN